MKTEKILLITALLLLAFGPLVMANPLLSQFDQELIGEIQASRQTVSQKTGLADTIEMILDCTAHGRTNVALIGTDQVPEPVLKIWKHDETAVAGVSISRYSLGLNPKTPDTRTDFYRFRTERADGTIAELLIKNIAEHKKAMRIFSFVDGDPTGQFQTLQTTLQDLLGVVEEGSITVAEMPLSDTPQGVAKAWQKYSSADPAAVKVERFITNAPDGEEEYWLLTHQGLQGDHQAMLVHRNKIIFNRINEKLQA